MNEIKIAIIKAIVAFINRISPIKLINMISPWSGRSEWYLLKKEMEYMGYPIYSYINHGTLPQEETIAITWSLLGNHFITVQELFYEFLTSDEQQAVLLHEIGHIKLGHLEGEIGIMSNEIKEIEADNYASKFGFSKHMISALTKMGHMLTNKFQELYVPGFVIEQVRITLQDRISHLK